MLRLRWDISINATGQFFLGNPVPSKKYIVGYKNTYSNTWLVTKWQLSWAQAQRWLAFTIYQRIIDFYRESLTSKFKEDFTLNSLGPRGCILTFAETSAPAVKIKGDFEKFIAAERLLHCTWCYLAIRNSLGMTSKKKVHMEEHCPNEKGNRGVYFVPKLYNCPKVQQACDEIFYICPHFAHCVQ